MDFIFDRPSILITVVYSKYDNTLNLWNLETKPSKDMKRPLRSFEKIFAEDVNSYKLMSELWKTQHPKWKTNSAKTGDGTFHEWAYYHAGRWSFSINGWNEVQLKTDSLSKKGSLNEKLFTNAKLKNLKKAVIPWKKLSHPDFPNQKVELGGFHHSYKLSPDVTTFETTHSEKWIEKLTTLFPKLEVSQFSVKRVSKGLYRVLLTLKNNGKLSTQSEMGKWSKWMYPTRVEWALDKSKFVSGLKKTKLAPIEGFGGNVELTWLIKGKKGDKHQLEIISPVTNKISKTIKF